MPAWVLPAINMALGAAGIGVNAGLQNRTNKRSMEFQEKMYNLQRQDALSDFDMINQYNHPIQQMNRYREAGLSPNLIYGKGAHQAAAMVRSSQATSPSITAPRLENMGNLVQGFADLRIKQAQYDNTQAATLKLLSDAAKTQEEKRQLSDLFDLKVQDIKSQIAERDARQIYTLDKNKREELTTTKDLEKKTVEILHEIEKKANTIQERTKLRVAIDNARQEGRILQYKADLADKGINPDDPLWTRMIVELLSEYLPERKDRLNFIDKMKARWKDGLDYWKGGTGVNGAGGSW